MFACIIKVQLRNDDNFTVFYMFKGSLKYKNGHKTSKHIRATHAFVLHNSFYQIGIIILEC